MSRILIPRSSNISAKKVETSDFEKFFDSSILNNYIVCGFAVSVQCPNVLAVDVASGNIRLKGLHLNNSTCCSVTSLTACATNKIYVQICRDVCCEADEWTFNKTTGCIPACGLQIGTAITGCATVTSVCNDLKETIAISCTGVDFIFGDGSDGNVTISSNTDLTCDNYKQYNNLTINAGIKLSADSGFILKVRDTLTFGNACSEVSANGPAGGTGCLCPGRVEDAGDGGGMLFVFANKVPNVGRITANGGSPTDVTGVPTGDSVGCAGTDGNNDGVVEACSCGCGGNNSGNQGFGGGGGGSFGAGGDGGNSCTCTAGVVYCPAAKTCDFVGLTDGSGGGSGGSGFTSCTNYGVGGSMYIQFDYLYHKTFLMYYKFFALQL